MLPLPAPGRVPAGRRASNINLDPAPSALRLITLNVQGLTSAKFLTTLRWLRDQSAHGAILTETRLTSDPADFLSAEAGGGTIWPGVHILHTPGSGHTGGVCIVLGPGLHLSSPAAVIPPGIINGRDRILRIDLLLYDQPASIVGIYGPTSREERVAFWDNVPSFLSPDRPTLLCGDFNVVCHQNDIWYSVGEHPPRESSRYKGRESLKQLMRTFELQDLWRLEHGRDKVERTHTVQDGRSGARLDRFLASRSLLSLFSKSSCSILPCGPIKTDHRPVSLTLRAPRAAIPKGRGILGFPMAIFNIPEARTQLEALVRTESAAVLASPTPKRWQAAKTAILKFAHDTYTAHRQLRRKSAHDAEATVAAADILFTACPNPELRPVLLAALHAAEVTAHQAWLALLAPAALAARYLDHMFAEQPTYYFHSLARPPMPPHTIKTLNRPGRLETEDPEPRHLNTISGTADALTYAMDYFSSESSVGLFRRRETDLALQDKVIGSISRQLPPCLVDCAEGPDSDSLLTKEELAFAMHKAKRGSVPGEDGLPYEFYRLFAADLTPVLLAVFNGAFRAAQQQLQADPHIEDSALAPLRDLLMGIICLLPKPDQAQDELSKHRPITLLDCDVKLIMIIISDRLKLPLDYLIDVMQTAYIPGRVSSDSIRWHLGLRARLVELGLPAWLQLSDINKAYDKTDRPFLHRVKLRMGLKPDGAVLWSRILLNGSQAKVRINGFLSTAFNVLSGIPQGSMLSCYEWCIYFQGVFSYLNSLQTSGRLVSFPLPSGLPAPPCGAYADDINTFVGDHEQLGTVIRPAFDELHRAGAAEQSIPKTRVLHLSGDIPASMDAGLQPDHRHLASGYKLVTQAEEADLRNLGVPMSSSHDIRVTKAFGNMHGKIFGASARWKPVSMTRFGRTHVANSCLMSKAVYQSVFHKPTLPHLKLMQRAVHAFVARPSQAEEATPNSTCLYPRAAVCHLPPDRGGLGLLAFESQCPALMAKDCWRLFDYNGHPWADLFGHELALVLPRGNNADNGGVAADSGGVAADSGGAAADNGGAAADNGGAADSGQASMGVPPGYHWIVTCPSAGRYHLDNIATPSTRESVQAFLGLNVTRIAAPGSQSFHSILLETVFFNVVINPRTGDAAAEFLDPANDNDLTDQDPVAIADQDHVIADQDHVIADQDPATDQDRAAADQDIFAPEQDPITADQDNAAADQDFVADQDATIAAQPGTVFFNIRSGQQHHTATDNGYADPRNRPDDAQFQDPIDPAQDPHHVDQDQAATAVDQDPATNAPDQDPAIADADQDQDPAEAAAPSGGTRCKGLSPSDLSTPTARTWLRLRDVRAAYVNRLRLTQLELHDLRFVLNALPEPWLAAICGEPPDHSLGWRVVSAPGDALTFLEGPHPMSQLPSLWLLVTATGQLICVPSTTYTRDASIAPRPALVVTRKLPQEQWKRDDYYFVAAQLSAPKSDRRVLLQPRLVGLWDEMQLDPRVWGLSATTSPSSQDQDPADNEQDTADNVKTSSLLNMTVKSARLRFSHRLALSQRIDGYASSGSALPKIWRSTATAVNTVAITPSTPADVLRTLGIEGLEERWRRDLRDNVDDDDIDRTPRWLDLTSSQDPRSRDLRASNRNDLRAAIPLAAANGSPQPPPPTDDDDQGDNNFTGVWRRLCDPTLRRTFRSTCWSILHGTIGCCAFISHILAARADRNLLDNSSSYCANPTCRDARAQENITHAFMDCPAAAPAIDWLLQAWQHLSGAPSAPPRTAAVLLADDIGAWPEDSRPSTPEEIALWTRLRVNVLGAIWRVRCQRDLALDLRQESFARKAIAIAIDTLTEDIQRDWLRTQQDLRTLDNGNFCSAWWRGRDTQLTMDKFIDSWASPQFFCAVSGQGAEASLQLSIGLDQPIAFPP